MNHELNTQIATEMMGWIVQRGGPYSIYVTELAPDGEAWTEAWLPVPDFSGSLDATYGMEKEIKRRGLHLEYARLMDFHAPGWSSWRFLHATPEQKCRAALEAVREK